MALTTGDKVTFKRWGRTETGTFTGYALNGVDLKVSVARVSAYGRLPHLTTIVVKPAEVSCGGR